MSINNKKITEVQKLEYANDSEAERPKYSWMNGYFRYLTQISFLSSNFAGTTPAI